jgi:hypothetical protein
MQVFKIVIGLFLIALGFLVKAFPNLIAGYNTMSKEEKANVDVKGLSSLMRNGLISIGALIILAPMFFKWMGLSALANASELIIIFGGVITMLVFAQKYDRNNRSKYTQKRKYLAIIVLAIAIIGIVALIVQGTAPSKVDVNNNHIVIKGMYGIKISIDEIQHLEFVTEIPKEFIRTNGFHYGNTMKGNFRVSGFGQSKLYLQDYHKPFIFISYNNGYKALINFKAEDKTEECYRFLSSSIKIN